MPRRQTATMRQRLRCGVEFERSGIRRRWNEDTREYEDTPYTETVKCGTPRNSHKETISIKRKGERAGVRTIRPAKVTDHDFADPYHQPVKCRHCGEDIAVGDSYAYWLSKNRGRVNQHASCPSPPRAFWTNSEILANAWGISDQDVPEFGSYEDFEEWTQEIAEQIRSDLVELIEEKLSNIEDGFGHTELPVYYELEERKDAFEEWQTEFEEASYSFDADQFPCANCTFDAEEHEDCTEFMEQDEPERDNFDSDEDFEEAVGEFDINECGLCGRGEDEHACNDFEADLGELVEAASELLGEQSRVADLSGQHPTMDVAWCDRHQRQLKEDDVQDKYTICPDCHGEGHHVLHGHAYTQEELDEHGPEFVEDMLQGVYDTLCETCQGKRVVETAKLDDIYDEWQDKRTRMMESGIYDY